ncbi:MAG TPA: hypothetical protein PKD10_13690 [Paracoccaceae bacterium]|nr:hypothetical protein [Paracoccaceae bacterium]
MNRVIALLALAVLAGFLWILAAKVGRVDLSVVVGLTFLIAAFDIWQTGLRGKR